MTSKKTMECDEGNSLKEMRSNASTQTSATRQPMPNLPRPESLALPAQISAL